jgi:adenosylmethionine-8-amino-7-oxononanoate aminotransferase
VLRNEHDALWYNAITPERISDGSVAGTAVTKGKGCWVQDCAGRWYLDARAAMWNATLGYGNERVIDAMTAQLRQLPVAQIIRYEQPADISFEYARRLVGTLPGDLSHVRFGSTGSQMTSSAVLLSRFVRKVRQERGRTKVIAFHSAYHGTGGIAGALTGERPLHAMESPLVPDVHHVRPWDMDALTTMIERHGPDRVTAVIAEPIMGTGVRQPPPGMLAGIRRLCDEHGIHLIADEVTTGFGRTGAMSATVAAGVRPDMLILGKGITSGYAPLAAMVTTSEVFDEAIANPDYVFPHGSTADGHPVAMAAGLAVLDELADGEVFARVRRLGTGLRDRLAGLAQDRRLIQAVRGEGLMIGVELADEGEPLGAAAMAGIRQACWAEGLLVTTTDNTIVLMPPLVLSDAESAELVSKLDRAVGRIDHG